MHKVQGNKQLVQHIRLVIVFLASQLQFSKKSYLLLPYCYWANSVPQPSNQPTGEHWMLLVADVTNRTAYVLNSKPASSRYHEAANRLVQKWM